jgi:hypothetical protein
LTTNYTTEDHHVSDAIPAWTSSPITRIMLTFLLTHFEQEFAKAKFEAAAILHRKVDNRCKKLGAIAKFNV